MNCWISHAVLGSGQFCTAEAFASSFLIWSSLALNQRKWTSVHEIKFGGFGKHFVGSEDREEMSYVLWMFFFSLAAYQDVIQIT